MKWITRANANVDRAACPWLINGFVDPDAEFLFVSALHGAADHEKIRPESPMYDALYAWCQSH